ncbi:hypothetical protein [Xenorhabdus hominickii]|uniref:hypothetical protein n=1 Tax=Xenorhabdus hominickii TaxID=351679 RepID=UPI001474C7A0
MASADLRNKPGKNIRSPYRVSDSIYVRPHTTSRGTGSLPPSIPQPATAAMRRKTAERSLPAQPAGQPSLIIS